MSFFESGTSSISSTKTLIQKSSLEVPSSDAAEMSELEICFESDKSKADQGLMNSLAVFQFLLFLAPEQIQVLPIRTKISTSIPVPSVIPVDVVICLKTMTIRLITRMKIQQKMTMIVKRTSSIRLCQKVKRKQLVFCTFKWNFVMIKH